MTDHDPTPLERLLEEELERVKKERDALKVALAFRSPLNAVSKLQWRKPCMIAPEEHGWRPLTYKSDAAAIIAGKDAEIARLRAEVDRLETSLQDQCIACKWPSDCRAREEDVERLTKERDTEIARNNPLRALAKSQEERIAYLAKNCRGLDEARATLESERSANERLTNAIAQQAERIAELERERDDLLENAECFEQEASLATDELDTKIAAQADALAKARDALEGVCDSDEECQDSDGWTAAVISFEALHEAQEALETIAQLDGAHAEEHAHPASDADNAIYQSIARNYTAQAGEEGKEPRHD